MILFNKKTDSSSDTIYEKLLAEQANRLGISIDELKKLGVNKSCPKYGTKEILHARRVKGGQIIVFNISDRFRGEKISEGRKKINTKGNLISEKPEDSVKK